MMYKKHNHIRNKCITKIRTYTLKKKKNPSESSRREDFILPYWDYHAIPPSSARFVCTSETGLFLRSLPKKQARLHFDPKKSLNTVDFYQDELQISNDSQTIFFMICENRVVV